MAERHHGSHRHLEADEAPADAPDMPPGSAAAPAPEALPEPPPAEDAAPVPVIPPSAHVRPDTNAFWLIQAFTAMCTALRENLDDNEVLAGHCDEIQSWMANCGGDLHSTNAIMAFRHMVKILEEVLGQSMALP